MITLFYLLCSIIDKTKSLKEMWTPTLQHHTRVSTEALKHILPPVACVLAKTYEELPKLKVSGFFYVIDFHLPRK
jgi:hypothetical protein